jgi:hypothetical protein
MAEFRRNSEYVVGKRGKLEIHKEDGIIWLRIGQLDNSFSWIDSIVNFAFVKHCIFLYSSSVVAIISYAIKGF